MVEPETSGEKQTEGIEGGVVSDEAIVSSLDVLTASDASDVELPFTYTPIKFGMYQMEEVFLTESEKLLLHGRAFVVDRVAISAFNSSAPMTYYIANDQVQGLVVPARSLAIENNGDGNVYYRWTDEGEKWSAWITIEEGGVHDYGTDEKCRFAEVQVYGDSSGGMISMVATR